jgi:hypothetical protein
MMMAPFWNVASCRLVEIHRRFRGAYCLHLHVITYSALMMEAVNVSEAPVNFYETTRSNIPEDGHLQVTFSFFTYLHVTDR